MKLIKVITLALTIGLTSCKSHLYKSQQSNNTLVKKDPKVNQIKFPKLIGFVSDYEKILTKSEIDNLTNTIITFKKKTTNEIVIVTLDSINPYTDMQQYATDLANNWGIGKIDINNGLMIVLSKNLRKIGIATGYGTEKVLTNQICKNIIDSIMIPEFKKDRYYNGIKNGLTVFISKWK